MQFRPFFLFFFSFGLCSFITVNFPLMCQATQHSSPSFIHLRVHWVFLSFFLISFSLVLVHLAGRCLPHFPSPHQPTPKHIGQILLFCFEVWFVWAADAGDFTLIPAQGRKERISDFCLTFFLLSPAESILEISVSSHPHDCLLTPP